MLSLIKAIDIIRAETVVHIARNELAHARRCSEALIELEALLFENVTIQIELANTLIRLQALKPETDLNGSSAWKSFQTKSEDDLSTLDQTESMEIISIAGTSSSPSGSKNDKALIRTSSRY